MGCGVYNFDGRGDFHLVKDGQDGLLNEASLSEVLF